MFDLTLFPLSIISGREQYDLPGLLAVNAPRKCERMRAQDQLLLYMHLVTPTGAPSQFTHSQQKEILSRLAETYFNATGSVTSGLRMTAARLNDFLLNRNLKAGQDVQTVGSLTLAVAHGSSLYVAHSGPSHTFVLSQNQVQHYADGQGMRGLGLSRQAVPRFYQTTIAAGDMLVFCVEPPANWVKSLAGSPAISFDNLRRRMVSDAAGDLQAAVLRFGAGKGLVNIWRPAAPKPGQAETAPAPAADQRKPTQRPTAPARIEPPPAALNEAAVAIDSIGGVNLPNPAAVDGEPPSLTVAQVDVDNPGNVSFQPVQAASVPETENAVSPGKAGPARSAPEGEKAVFLGLGVKKDQAQEPPSPRPARRGLLDVFHIPSLRGKSAAEQKPKKPVEAKNASVDQKTAVAKRSQAAAVQPASQAPAKPPAAVWQPAPSSLPVAEPASPAGSIQPSAGHSHAPAAEKHPAAGSARHFIRSNSPGHVTSVPLREPVQLEAKEPANPSPLQWLGAQISALWRGSSQARTQMHKAVGGATAKVLPKRSEPLFNLSPSGLMLIAILVPVMVVTAATTVYFRAGRSEQFTILLGQAKNYAKQASSQQDPALYQQSWNSVYDLVVEAERYGSSEESAALRKQAEQALDEAQGITRLDFRTAQLDRFGPDLNITRMVATLNQVFLLDSNRGRILSLTRVTSGDYEANQYFTCSPAKAGGAIVGPLIDMAEIPINNELGAEILGIDGGGNLVYCAAGKEGFDSQSLALPDLGWGQITAITTYGDTLYVLDPPNNAVYRYDGEKGIFAGKPHLYFDQDIPMMKDVIDLAIDQEFLYLLHADGSMTVCSSGGVSFGNTRCTDPSPYGDSRPGADPAPLVFPGAQLTQIQTTRPPDPSLFALDPSSRAIYHLSQRRMNLQHIYLNRTDSDYPYPKSAATAFAITPNRRILIAFGNQLFFAILPK